jgi:uncharacterized protein involved in type VI secretion and phage assembly
MNAPFSQVERLGRLTTVLGDDVLVLLRFAGSDHVNALFEYRVEALAANAALDLTNCWERPPPSASTGRTETGISMGS